MAVERTVIAASPRIEGMCSRISVHVQDALQARYPQDNVNMLMVPEMRIAGCTGCGRCRLDGTCFMVDDMERVHLALDASSELVVVSPVYFAGPPSQYKALLDRLQPCYWHPWKETARPATLVVVGEGGDPHGYEPLVVCTRSALALAGFKLQRTIECIGVDVDAAARIVNEQLFG